MQTRPGHKGPGRSITLSAGPAPCRGRRQQRWEEAPDGIFFLKHICWKASDDQGTEKGDNSVPQSHGDENLLWPGNGTNIPAHPYTCPRPWTGGEIQPVSRKGRTCHRHQEGSQQARPLLFFCRDGGSTLGENSVCCKTSGDTHSFCQ